MRTKWYSYVALILSIWFALTSWFWPGLFNLYYSFPFGLVAFGLWYLGKQGTPGDSVNKWVMMVLLTGWLSAVFTLSLFL